MKNAHPAALHADGNVLETDPDEVVRAVLGFLGGAPAP
jgi:hypothetical protein